jgi:hypothetical protein
MERDGLQQRAETVPPCETAVEQFALQALVDRLFTESDARVFLILNKYFQGESNE